MLASFFSQGLPRVLLDLALIAAVAGYLGFCLIRNLKPVTSVSKPPRSLPEPMERELLQNLADGILGINDEDQIVYSSQRAESLLGFTHDDLKSRNYQDFIILPDGFNEASTLELKQGTQVIGIEHPAWAMHRNGRRFPVRITVTPCRKGPIRALVALRVSHAERPPALPQAGLEPARLLNSAERIKKLATHLGNSKDLSPYDRDFLKALQNTTDHLFADINLLKCLKSIEANEIQANPQPVHLGQWLEKESLAYHDLAGKRGSHLTVPQLRNSDLVLVTDEGILGQIYQALLDFSLTTYQSPSITFHLTHNPLNPAPNSSRSLAENRAGQSLKVRFLIIVAAPQDEDESVTATPGKSLVDTVEADPHIRLARQLLPLIGAELSIDANDFSGLLFQFSLSCKSLGLSRHPALPREDPARKDAGINPLATGAQESVTPSPAREKQVGTVLSIAENNSLRKWVREILMAEGFRVEEYQPGEAIEKIRDGKEADVVVLQRELSTEPDFDLTYEIRQLRKAEDMPILLVHVGEHPDPKISYFCAEDAIDYPAENQILKEKVSALCGLRAQS